MLGTAYNSGATDVVRLAFKREMLRARRRGCWFRLEKSERSLYSLALRLRIQLQSPQLLHALVSILKKLKESTDSLLTVLSTGAVLARTFSDAAVSWGNPTAHPWRTDRAYILYLGRSFEGGRTR